MNIYNFDGEKLNVGVFIDNNLIDIESLTKLELSKDSLNIFGTEIILIDASVSIEQKQAVDDLNKNKNESMLTFELTIQCGSDLCESCVRSVVGKKFGGFVKALIAKYYK